jgi:hypothetical protein
MSVTRQPSTLGAAALVASSQSARDRVLWILTEASGEMITIANTA